MTQRARLRPGGRLTGRCGPLVAAMKRCLEEETGKRLKSKSRAEWGSSWMVTGL